jgi:hypothetical protein
MLSTQDDAQNRRMQEQREYGDLAGLGNAVDTARQDMNNKNEYRFKRGNDNGVCRSLIKTGHKTKLLISLNLQ